MSAVMPLELELYGGKGKNESNIVPADGCRWSGSASRPDASIKMPCAGFSP